MPNSTAAANHRRRTGAMAGRGGGRSDPPSGRSGAKSTAAIRSPAAAHASTRAVTSGARSPPSTSPSAASILRSIASSRTSCMSSFTSSSEAPFDALAQGGPRPLQQGLHTVLLQSQGCGDRAAVLAVAIRALHRLLRLAVEPGDTLPQRVEPALAVVGHLDLAPAGFDELGQQHFAPAEIAPPPQPEVPRTRAQERRHRRLAAILVQPFHRHQERLLQQILGEVRRCPQRTQVTPQAELVATHQRLEVGRVRGHGSRRVRTHGRFIPRHRREYSTNPGIGRRDRHRRAAILVRPVPTNSACATRFSSATARVSGATSILGPVRLVREGPLDYLALDYLAEVTMSIMQKLKGRNPKAGYATDFVKMLERTLPDIHKKGIKVVANAGGVNPQACLDAVLELARKQGIKGLKVGVIEGDDILARLPELQKGGHMLANMDDGRPLSACRTSCCPRTSTSAHSPSPSASRKARRS
jgi:hypothetical protein